MPGTHPGRWRKPDSSRAEVSEDLDLPRGSWLILCLAHTCRASLSLQLHGQATALRCANHGWGSKGELGSRAELLLQLWSMQWGHQGGLEPCCWLLILRYHQPRFRPKANRAMMAYFSRRPPNVIPKCLPLCHSSPMPSPFTQTKLQITRRCGWH